MGPSLMAMNLHNIDDGMLSFSAKFHISWKVGMENTLEQYPLSLLCVLG
jgi:hypothetical protein